MDTYSHLDAETASHEARHAPDELDDKLTRLRERLRSRLTCANLDPPENYVERDGFEVLIQFNISGNREQYEALVSRVPAHLLDSNSRYRLEPCYKAFAGNGCHFENLLHVPVDNTSENPEWLAIPSTVRIKRADQFANVFGKSRYFSPETGRFLWSLTKGCGEYSAPFTGQCDSLHDVVENAPKGGENTLGIDVEGLERSGADAPFVVSPRWVLLNDEIYLLISGMKVFLGPNYELIEFEKGVNGLIEVRDVYFGPLGFPDCAR